MAKYLFIASYTAEGAQGLLIEGGSSRRTAIEGLIRGRGGSLESFYFAFGGDDLYAVADLPDRASAVALSLAVSASGAASVRTVVLIDPEEVDAATSGPVGYRGPGT
jgi:uncharacterized protein with GYD domain